MARREPSDPSAALARVQAGFRGGFTGLSEALERRRKLQDAIRLLNRQDELQMAQEERDPERIVQRIGLRAAQTAGETAAPPGGFSRAELKQPQALERAFAPVRQNRVLDVLKQFGLVKPSMTGMGQAVFTVDPTSGTLTQIGSVPRGSRTIPIPQEPVFVQEAQFGAQQVAGTIQNLREKFAKAQTVRRGPGAVISGLFRGAKATAQLDPAVSDYVGEVELMLGRLSRTVGAEKGNLAAADVDRIRKGVPPITTSLETADVRFDSIEKDVVDTAKAAIDLARRKRGEAPIPEAEVRQRLGFEPQLSEATGSTVQQQIQSQLPPGARIKSIRKIR